MKRISLGSIERKTVPSFSQNMFAHHCSPWSLSSCELQSKWNLYVSHSFPLSSLKCRCRSFVKSEQFLRHLSLWNRTQRKNRIVRNYMIILNYPRNFTELVWLNTLLVCCLLEMGKQFSQINPHSSFCSLPFCFHCFSRETEGIWPAKRNLFSPQGA